MKRYDILLFDADNTLFDFGRCEYEAFRETARQGGFPFSDILYERYARINDELWKRLERKEISLDFLKAERFRLLLLSMGEPEGDGTAERAAVLRDVYMDSLSEQAVLMPGAAELCRELAAEYALYIVTNGISRIQRSRFARSGLEPYFRAMFVSEEIGIQKPEKGYFDAVFSALGNPEKSRVLMIGDSLTSDADGAIGYGLDFCRFNPGGLPDEGRAVTYTVKKLSEVKDILGGLTS